MRVLILGAAGMLGTDLVASTPRGATSVALDHADVDITDRAALAAVLDRTRPEVVINAALEKIGAGTSCGRIADRAGRANVRVTALRKTTEYIAGTSNGQS